MHDQHEPDAGQRTRRKATSPSSSRMIATYLTDIEQMLDEERWDAALREASDLPRIAVALADPGLRSPGEQVEHWCQEWVQLPGAKREARGTDYERLKRGVADRAVPSRARAGTDARPASPAAASSRAHPPARLYGRARRGAGAGGDRSGADGRRAG